MIIFVISFYSDLDDSFHPDSAHYTKAEAEAYLDTLDPYPYYKPTIEVIELHGKKPE